MDFLSKEGGRLQFGLQRLGQQMWAHSRVVVGLGVAKATLCRGKGVGLCPTVTQKMVALFLWLLNTGFIV